MSTAELVNIPNKEGYFGDYGGSFLPPELQTIMEEITDQYNAIRQSPEFQDELKNLYQHYVGRPSPIFFAEGLTKEAGGAKIYFKREDLNHTGAHKINHCLGEVLLAKRWEKEGDCGNRSRTARSSPCNRSGPPWSGMRYIHG